MAEVSGKCHIVKSKNEGATVAERLARSPPTKAIRVQSQAGSPDFRMWASCRAMPLVGEPSWGSPASPTLSFRRYSVLTSIALIGSEDLAVKSRPNFFTHSMNGDGVSPENLQVVAAVPARGVWLCWGHGLLFCVNTSTLTRSDALMFFFYVPGTASLDHMRFYGYHWIAFEMIFSTPIYLLGIWVNLRQKCNSHRPLGDQYTPEQGRTINPTDAQAPKAKTSSLATTDRVMPFYKSSGSARTSSKTRQYNKPYQRSASPVLLKVPPVKIVGFQTCIGTCGILLTEDGGKNLFDVDDPYIALQCSASRVTMTGTVYVFQGDRVVRVENEAYIRSWVTNARLHHRSSKLDPRSDLRPTQKTVAPFEFRAGLEIENHEISLVQHFYIGTKIKLDPVLELGSFELGSGKMLVQPGIRPAFDESNLQASYPAAFLQAILHGTRFRKSLCKVCHSCRYTGLYGTRHGIVCLALPDFITGLEIGPALFSVAGSIPALVPGQPHCSFKA
ncbi:hypothetical protein PR048_021810 [Dryococelus australis]|uniref:Uncharacterized protein n=1 Tax=Dryococelus australis TaxID=614101 RepID=A0ABQ9GZH2_9NEOP|nr:hypothetical protein PR048_021810 [Dryococelus australis]